MTATETEYHIALSSSTFTPGTYTFTATDQGHFAHDLVINGPGVALAKTKLLTPGESGSVTVTLQAGTYNLFCGVDGHKALGMNLEVQVS